MFLCAKYPFRNQPIKIPITRSETTIIAPDIEIVQNMILISITCVFWIKNIVARITKTNVVLSLMF